MGTPSIDKFMIELEKAGFNPPELKELTEFFAESLRYHGQNSRRDFVADMAEALKLATSASTPVLMLTTTAYGVSLARYNEKMDQLMQEVAHGIFAMRKLYKVFEGVPEEDLDRLKDEAG